MFQRKKLHLAVLSAIAATTAPHASAELEEIVVTATKRAVPLQDAPVTIQAIGSKELEDQNIVKVLVKENMKPGMFIKAFDFAENLIHRLYMVFDIRMGNIHHMQ